MIDTAKVPGRRELHFKTLDDALREADRLADIDRAGRLEHLGNWTLGQALGHLATWTGFAFTGSPRNPPLILKFILRFMKQKFLYGKMRSGVHIPGVENGTFGTEVTSTADGLRRYHEVMERLRREAPTIPNGVFGHLTHDEWNNLQLRHAELHMSFFRERA